MRHLDRKGSPTVRVQSRPLGPLHAIQRARKDCDDKWQQRRDPRRMRDRELVRIGAAGWPALFLAGRRAFEIVRQHGGTPSPGVTKRTLLDQIIVILLG